MDYLLWVISKVQASQQCSAAKSHLGKQVNFHEFSIKLSQDWQAACKR